MELLQNSNRNFFTKLIKGVPPKFWFGHFQERILEQNFCFVDDKLMEFLINSKQNFVIKTHEVAKPKCPLLPNQFVYFKERIRTNLFITKPILKFPYETLQSDQT